MKTSQVSSNTALKMPVSIRMGINDDIDLSLANPISKDPATLLKTSGGTGEK